MKPLNKLIPFLTLMFAGLLAGSIGLGGRAQEGGPAPTPSPTGANVCTSLVRAAMESTDQQCGDTTRNHACYGHILNTATFRSGRELVFEAQGDKAALDQIQTLNLSPLDLELEQWGVVLLQAQANLPDQLPGQNVTFILFGDVQVENAVGGAVEVEARLTEAASIRIAPGTNRAVIASLTPEVGLFASGKYFNADGELWVRVGQSIDTEAFGWVEASRLNTDLDRLPNISPNGDSFNPMQAFYFKTGIGQPQCIEAPRDGMVVQTPRGAGKIDFTINGIDVDLGSTAYITSPEDFDNTCVSLIAGEAILEAGNVSKTLKPGQKSCVELDEAGIADSPPSEPDSFDPNEIALIQPVLDVLPEDVVIPDPAPSNTPTFTNTPRPTATPTATPTHTETPLPQVNSPVPSATPTTRPTRVRTTPTHTPTHTATFTPTFTPAPPVARFTFGISAMNVIFTDASLNAPTSWTWDFGDDTSANVQNPTHGYFYPGVPGSTSYTVSLTACNAVGCDTASQTITLDNCNYDVGLPRQVDFIASSSIGSDPAVESYDIVAKDTQCRPGAVLGTVNFTTNATGLTVFEGQHVYTYETNTAIVCDSYVINGPGPFTFTVGGTCLRSRN